MGICPKVNVIARLEFELTYYDSEVHRFNHYTTRTPEIAVTDSLDFDDKKREKLSLKNDNTLGSFSSTWLFNI